MLLICIVIPNVPTALSSPTAWDQLRRHFCLFHSAAPMTVTGSWWLCVTSAASAPRSEHDSTRPELSWLRANLGGVLPPTYTIRSGCHACRLGQRCCSDEALTKRSHEAQGLPWWASPYGIRSTLLPPDATSQDVGLLPIARREFLHRDRDHQSARITMSFVITFWIMCYFWLYPGGRPTS